MAFARAAIIKNAVKRLQPIPIATEMLGGVDAFVEVTFANDTPETLKYYKNERLSVIAPGAIRYYEQNVFPLEQLADVFAHRLSIPACLPRI